MAIVLFLIVDILLFNSRLKYLEKAKGEPLFAQIITYAWVSVFGIISFYLLLWHLIGKEEIHLDTENSFFKRSLLTFGLKRKLGNIDSIQIERFDYDLFSKSIVRFIVTSGRFQIRNKYNKYVFGNTLTKEQEIELLDQLTELKKIKTATNIG